MSKTTIWAIVTGVLATVALFCVIICIACACNGLTFGGQITSWFGGKAAEVITDGGEVLETISSIV